MLIRAMAKELDAASAHECLFVDFLSKEEPKKVSEALQHPRWVDSMQDELNQFARNKVWTLVLTCSSRLKAAKGMDYDETFAPVAILEAIRIFLAFATYMNFIVYQMDVKSAFINGKLKEEVYVKQPQGFESNEFLNHVCKLDKALYRLKQAPRAWYLKGTPILGLWYPKCSGFDLKGYSDSDYVRCNMDKKSTSAEGEYVAAARCCANILWMKSRITDYDIIYEMISFIKDHNLKGDIELHFIPTQYQLINIFTKPLDEPTLKILIVELDNEREELCEVHELPVCNVRRYMMIKYLFNNDEEYVAIKEDEYDDLTITRKEACRAYQEIFRIMDEGWMVTRAESFRKQFS
ncbi:retrovirus-related pol polyprotein from transposon TNT 1-94 [Tanacetum coccineum]